MSGNGGASADGANDAAPTRVPPRPKIRPFPTPTRLRAAPSGVRRPPSWSSRRFLPPAPTSRLPSASSIAAAAIASSSPVGIGNGAGAVAAGPPPPPRRRTPSSGSPAEATPAPISMEAHSRNHSSTAPSNSAFATTVQGDTNSRFTFHSDIPLPPQYRRCKKTYESGNISKTMPKLNPPPGGFRRQGSRTRSVASLNAFEKDKIPADTSNSGQFSSAPLETSFEDSRSSLDYSKRSAASASRPRAPAPPPLAAAKPRQTSGRTRAQPAPVSQPIVRRAPAVPQRRRAPLASEPLRRRAVPPPPERIRSDGMQNAPSMPMARRAAAAPRPPPGPLDRQSHSTPGSSRIRVAPPRPPSRRTPPAQRQQDIAAHRHPAPPARRRAEPIFAGATGGSSAQPSVPPRVPPTVPRRIPVQAAPESGKPNKRVNAGAKPPPIPQRHSPRQKNDEEWQLLQLEKEMNMAIANQQFEKCTALRDQIQRLRDQQKFMLDPLKVEDARKKLNESLNQAIENQRFELCVEIRDKTAKLDKLVKNYDDSPTNRDKKVFLDELNLFFASAL